MMTTHGWARNAVKTYRATGIARAFSTTPAGGGSGAQYPVCKGYIREREERDDHGFADAKGFADFDDSKKWNGGQVVEVPRLSGAPRPAEGDVGQFGDAPRFRISNVRQHSGFWEVESLSEDGSAMFTLPAFALSTGDPLVAPVVVVDGAHPAGSTSVLTRNDGAGTLSGEAPAGSGVMLDATLYTIGEKSRAAKGVLTLNLSGPLLVSVANGATVDGAAQSITVTSTLAVSVSSYYSLKSPEAKATVTSGFEFARSSVETIPTADWSCVRGVDSGQVVDVDYREGRVTVWLGRKG